MALVLLPCDLPTWPSLQRHLNQLRLVATVDDLIDGMNKINALCNVGLDPDEPETSDPQQFDGFRTFLDDFMEPSQKERFFRTCLPALLNYALKLKLHKPPLGFHFSLQQQEHQVELERRFVASLLAHSFFSTFPRRTRKTHPTLQDTNFASFFQYLPQSQVQKSKLLAILHYFERLSDAEATGSLTFRRHVMPGKEWLTIEDWLECSKPLCPVKIRHEGRLENAEPGSLHVCFASSHLGGEVLLQGTTQECLHFSCNPELLSVLPFVESLEDNESLSAQGYQPAGVINDLKGRSNFDSTLRNVRVDSNGCPDTATCFIDAEDYSDFPLRQYEEDNILRELNKAFLGFRQPERPTRPSPIGRESDCSTPPFSKKSSAASIQTDEVMSPTHDSAMGSSRRSSTRDSYNKRLTKGSDSGVTHDLSTDEKESFATTTATVCLNPRSPGFLEAQKANSQGSFCVFRTAEENLDWDEHLPPDGAEVKQITAPVETPVKKSQTTNWLIPELSLTQDSDSYRNGSKGSQDSSFSSSRKTESVPFGGRRGPLTLTMGRLVPPPPPAIPRLDSASKCASVYTSCQSESEEDYHSATGSFDGVEFPPEDDEVEGHKYVSDLDTPERRQSFAARLRGALLREQQNQSSSSIHTSSSYSDYNPEDSDAAYAVDISIAGPDVGDNDEIRMRRGGSRGFLLAEEMELLGSEEGSSDIFDDNSAFSDEQKWIGRFKRQTRGPMSRKGTGDSSRYSFSSDFSSEMDELYDQFGQWFTDDDQNAMGKNKEVDSRDVAVLRFAHSLLRRTLSDSFASVAMGIENLSEQPCMRSIKLSGSAASSDPSAATKVPRSLSLNERLCHEKIALEVAKKLVGTHVQPGAPSSAYHVALKQLSNKLSSGVQEFCHQLSVLIMKSVNSSYNSWLGVYADQTVESAFLGVLQLFSAMRYESYSRRPTLTQEEALLCKNQENQNGIEGFSWTLAGNILAECITASLLYTESSSSDQPIGGNGPRPIISGNWGCGAKSGDPQLKAMLQWLAASRSNCPCFIYHTCSNTLVLKMDTVCRLLVDRHWTVGELTCALLRYAKWRLDVHLQPEALDETTTSSLFEELMGLDKSQVANIDTRL